MAYIYKTGRAELREQIDRHKLYVHGKVLDVGAGSFARYRDLFTCDEYVKMDIEGTPDTDVTGHIEAIPFPDNTFDSIVCTQVLGDVYELKKAFSELYRVLKPNGNALITENLFDSIHGEPHDYWRLTEHSFRRLSEEAGFRVEVLERRGGYWSVMSQMKARYWIELLNLNKKWYARGFSIMFKIHGALSRLLDSKDNSHANKLFTHGYLLIIRK